MKDIGRVNNPYLENVEFAAWNRELRLLAFGDQGPLGTLPNDRPNDIVVTNLDGSYYHRFTDSGAANDGGPTWGPGGGVLLFTRWDHNPEGGAAINLRLMKVDLKTGEESILVESGTIDGAIGLLAPSYMTE